MHDHERLEFEGPHAARAGRAVRLTFRLSKISCVTVRVKRGSTTVFESRLLTPYGTRSFTWVPRSAGRYSVEFTAYDYLNHLTVDKGRLTVRR